MGDLALRRRYGQSSEGCTSPWCPFCARTVDEAWGEEAKDEEAGIEESSLATKAGGCKSESVTSIICEESQLLRRCSFGERLLRLNVAVSRRGKTQARFQLTRVSVLLALSTVFRVFNHRASVD